MKHGFLKRCFPVTDLSWINICNNILVVEYWILYFLSHLNILSLEILYAAYTVHAVHHYYSIWINLRSFPISQKESIWNDLSELKPEPDRDVHCPLLHFTIFLNSFNNFPFVYVHKRIRTPAKHIVSSDYFLKFILKILTLNSEFLKRKKSELIFFFTVALIHIFHLIYFISDVFLSVDIPCSNFQGDLKWSFEKWSKLGTDQLDWMSCTSYSTNGKIYLTDLHSHQTSIKWFFPNTEGV